jgi:N-acyl-D-amino-acid deacylase
MKCNRVRLVTISQRIEMARFGDSTMLKRHITVFLFCTAMLAACGDPVPIATSTLITNAIIHDGSGGEPIHGAVRIDGDRIIGIGELEPLGGETIIDAGGLALAPGFIDTHSHHDGGMAEYRHMPGVLSQGVTTIVRGVDGSSDSEDDGQHLPQDVFNAMFEDSPTAVNIASFSAHNSIRYAVMGDDNRRPATTEEIAAMATLVEADMKNGAIGLATGLEYEPGIFSETDEVVELAKIAAQFGGRYMSHVRDEDDLQMDAFDEVIQIGREARLPVHISHIKLADREYWGTADAVIERLDAARSEGIEISADIYPYQRWASNLAVLFPARDYSDRSVADFTFEHTATPEDIVLSYYAPNPEFDGLTVAQVASILEKDVATTLMELALAADDYRKETGHGGAGIIAKGMDEGDVAALMLWEHANICSDGGHGGGHPRGYGAFPRVLGRFVRKLGVLAIEDAIYKMTVLPAATMGFEKRGHIQSGYYADLVLFNPDTIEDKSTMLDPTALSVGIEKVWVNGTLAFENGEPTMVYPGRIVARNEQ